MKKPYVHVFSYFCIFHQPGNNLGSSKFVWKRRVIMNVLFTLFCIHDSKCILIKHSICMLQRVFMISKNLYIKETNKISKMGTTIDKSILTDHIQFLSMPLCCSILKIRRRNAQKTERETFIFNLLNFDK